MNSQDAFTVRYVAPSGHITFYATDYVQIQPTTDIVKEQVFVQRPDGTMQSISDGSIFIMNAHGKTVGVKHFPFSEPVGEEVA